MQGQVVGRSPGAFHLFLNFWISSSLKQQFSIRPGGSAFHASWLLRPCSASWEEDGRCSTVNLAKYGGMRHGVKIEMEIVESFGGNYRLISLFSMRVSNKLSTWVLIEPEQNVEA